MAPDIAKYPLRHTTVPDSEPQDKRAVKYKDSIYIHIYIWQSISKWKKSETRKVLVIL